MVDRRNEETIDVPLSAPELVVSDAVVVAGNVVVPIAVAAEPVVAVPRPPSAKPVSSRPSLPHAVTNPIRHISTTPVLPKAMGVHCVFCAIDVEQLRCAPLRQRQIFPFIADRLQWIGNRKRPVGKSWR